MQLPADGHVHSQFSWDAYKVGDMEATCARAVEVGLPAVVFTEHVDFTPFRAGFLAPDYPDLVDEKGENLSRDTQGPLAFCHGQQRGRPAAVSGRVHGPVQSHVRCRDAVSRRGR